MRAAIDKPRPVPVSFVLKNGSKRRFSISGEMPLPGQFVDQARFSNVGTTRKHDLRDSILWEIPERNGTYDEFSTDRVHERFIVEATKLG